MRVTCKHCGGAHPAFECRKKSTEPKNMPVANGVVPAARVEPTDSAVRAKQAVDINPGPAPAGSIPASSTNTGLRGHGKSASGKALQGEGVQIPNGPPKFDKKAWQREYMREYMRKRRAAK